MAAPLARRSGHQTRLWVNRWRSGCMAILKRLVYLGGFVPTLPLPAKPRRLPDPCVSRSSEWEVFNMRRVGIVGACFVVVLFVAAEAVQARGLLRRCCPRARSCCVQEKECCSPCQPEAAKAEKPKKTAPEVPAKAKETQPPKKAPAVKEVPAEKKAAVEKKPEAKKRKAPKVKVEKKAAAPKEKPAELPTPSAVPAKEKP